MASVLVLVGPWSIAGLALVLTYKIVIVILVQTSKHDTVFRDRWTGIWVRRGKSDSEPSAVLKRPPHPALRSVDEPASDTGPPARSS